MAEQRHDVFRRIFDENYWGNDQSISGEGSNLERTAVIRAELPRLLARHGVRSMLDAPCGDFFWMKELVLDVDYIGADILPELIARNTEQYASPRRRFIVGDLVDEVLPHADLILCRDCLVHLTVEEIRYAVANFKESGAVWLLTTTFTGPRDNPDIVTGDWRPVNFERPPFNFGPPVEIINEQCDEDDGMWADKSLGLWRLADLTGWPI